MKSFRVMSPLKDNDKSLPKTIFETGFEAGNYLPTCQKAYHLIGNSQLRRRLMDSLKNPEDSDCHSKVTQNRRSAERKRQAIANNSTMTKRAPPPIVERFNRTFNQELNETRNCRALSQHQKIEDRWLNMRKKIQMQRGDRSLTMAMSPRIYVERNPVREELMNENVPQFWEHSLRNHHRRLRKTIRGCEIQEDEVDKLLVTSQGTKMLESRVPWLNPGPAEGQLTLSGRGMQNNSWVSQSLLLSSKIMDQNSNSQAREITHAN